jgi:hypothetical protein
VFGSLTSIADTLANFYIWGALGYPEVFLDGVEHGTEASFTEIWGDLRRWARRQMIERIDSETRPKRSPILVIRLLWGSAQVDFRILFSEPAAKLFVASVIPRSVRRRLKILRRRGEGSNASVDLSGG